MAKQKPYRARRVDNNEWVYGQFFHNKMPLHIGKSHYIIVDEVHDRKSTQIDMAGETFAAYPVVPSTVSQSTGCKDKHGVEIYGGMTLSSDSGGLFKVVWVDLLAAFWVVEQTTPYQKYTAEIIEKLEIIEGE